MYQEKFCFTPCSARSKKSNQKKGRSTRSKEKKRQGRQLEAEEWRLPGLHNIFAQGNRSYIEAMVIPVVKFEGRDTKLYVFSITNVSYCICAGPSPPLLEKRVITSTL